MVDKATDISNHEQVVICLRWVDDDFNVHEDLIGLYKVETISADGLVGLIKNALLIICHQISPKANVMMVLQIYQGLNLGLPSSLLMRNPEHYTHTAMDTH